MAIIKNEILSYCSAERERQIQAIESTKQFKKQRQFWEVENAEQAISDMNNYVITIQSLHKNCSSSIDWNEIQNLKKPAEPKREFRNETNAIQQLENFKPSVFDKILGARQKKINILKNHLEQAKKNDIVSNELAHSTYIAKLESWKKLQKISKGVEKKEINSFKDTLQYFNPFLEIEELGTRISFEFESDYVDIEFHINTFETIPSYELKQTAANKLVKKNMPRSRFNELYRNYVCSSVIRIVKEIYSHIPVECVRINVVSQNINNKTVFEKEYLILSVLFPSETIYNLDIENITPSKLIQNFDHNMTFSKTRGFGIVKKIKLNNTIDHNMPNSVDTTPSNRFVS